MFGRNAWTIVGDAQNDVRVFTTDPGRYAASCGCKLHGVVKNVDRRLAEDQTVTPHKSILFAFKFEFQLLFFNEYLQQTRSFLHNIRDRKYFKLHQNLTGVAPG